MNTNETDNKLQQLFDELKGHDARRAPAFSRLAQAPSRRTHPTPWWLLPATAVVVLAAISLSLMRTRPHRSQDDASQWAAFSTWATPTDVLLDTPNWMSSPGSVSDKTVN